MNLKELKDKHKQLQDEDEKLNAQINADDFDGRADAKSAAAVTRHSKLQREIGGIEANIAAAEEKEAAVKDSNTQGNNLMVAAFAAVKNDLAKKFNIDDAATDKMVRFIQDKFKAGKAPKSNDEVILWMNDTMADFMKTPEAPTPLDDAAQKAKVKDMEKGKPKGEGGANPDDLGQSPAPGSEVNKKDAAVLAELTKTGTLTQVNKGTDQHTQDTDTEEKVASMFRLGHQEVTKNPDAFNRQHEIVDNMNLNG